jgi:hypothetical protein
MKAVGELYLSRLKPHGQTAADGPFVLTLQAYDRQGYKQVQPWRLVWSGSEAKTFFDVHKAHLLPGAVLDVTATQLRQVTTPGRDCGPEIIAQVKSLYLPVIAANPQQRPHRQTAGQQACAA